MVQVDALKGRSGKDSQPCRRVTKRRSPVALDASASKNEIVSISMSGSLPIRFGFRGGGNA